MREKQILTIVLLGILAYFGYKYFYKKPNKVANLIAGNGNGNGNGNGIPSSFWSYELNEAGDVLGKIEYYIENSEYWYKYDFGMSAGVPFSADKEYYETAYANRINEI